MLDHLIFNKLKWWSIIDGSEQMTANGKTWHALPTEVTIPADTTVSDITGNIRMTLIQKATAKVVGFYTDSNTDFYVIEGKFDVLSYGEVSGIESVKKSACRNPKWGGKHPLTYFWRAFKSLFLTKEVA